MSSFSLPALLMAAISLPWSPRSRESPRGVNFLLCRCGAPLLACAYRMSARPSQHSELAPVPTGLRVIESLTIVLFALMAFLLALK
jgi:hypothetical protein